jgi:hypothetical protein
MIRMNTYNGVVIAFLLGENEMYPLEYQGMKDNRYYFKANNGVIISANRNQINN